MSNLFEQAKEYFDRIPDGHRNTMRRPWNQSVDRTLRDMIERANCNGDCIINVGNGIYRPIPSDPVDTKEFHEYIAKDKSRAKSLLLKTECMETAFYHVGMEGDCEQQTERSKRRKGACESA